MPQAANNSNNELHPAAQPKADERFHRRMAAILTVPCYGPDCDVEALARWSNDRFPEDHLEVPRQIALAESIQSGLHALVETRALSSQIA